MTVSSKSYLCRIFLYSILSHTVTFVDKRHIWGGYERQAAKLKLLTKSCHGIHTSRLYARNMLVNIFYIFRDYETGS